LNVIDPKIGGVMIMGDRGGNLSPYPDHRNKHKPMETKKF
jgi:hypothetical protein